MVALGYKCSSFEGHCGLYIRYVCPESEDGYHHANSYQKDLEDGYFTCICSYCGREFTAYESDLKQSYQDQVSDLPATGITSSGKLLWQPTFSNVVQVKSYFSPNGSSLESNYTPLDSRVSFTSASNGFICSCVPSDFLSSSCYLSFLVYFSDFPVSGTYSFILTFHLRGVFR